MIPYLETFYVDIAHNSHFTATKEKMFLQMTKFSRSEVEPPSFTAPVPTSLVNNWDYACTYTSDILMLSGLSAQITDFLAVDKHYS